MRTIGIAGADITSNNKSGTDHVTAKQLTTARSKLYEVVLNVRTDVAADRLIWFYDTAAGAVTDVNPLFYVRAFFGVTTVLHMNGKLFNSGIYYVVATDEPADADTAPTEATANDCMVTCDYRVL